MRLTFIVLYSNMIFNFYNNPSIERIQIKVFEIKLYFT